MHFRTIQQNNLHAGFDESNKHASVDRDIICSYSPCTPANLHRKNIRVRDPIHFNCHLQHAFVVSIFVTVLRLGNSRNRRTDVQMCRSFELEFDNLL